MSECVHFIQLFHLLLACLRHSYYYRTIALSPVRQGRALYYMINSYGNRSCVIECMLNFRVGTVSAQVGINNKSRYAEHIGVTLSISRKWHCHYI